MTLLRTLMLAMLAWAWLLPPGAVAAERVQRSTDEQGTIRIGNISPASEEKAGAKAGEVKAPSGPVAPGQEPPPGFAPPVSRRPYGPEAEARRKAILERRQSLATAPEAPALPPPAQPEPPPPPKSP
jgi:hypothetical protein